METTRSTFLKEILSAIRQVQSAGLTSAGGAIPILANRLGRELAVIRYKGRVHDPWVIFLGGTGTGKSTLFNVFCHAELSAVSQERPKTFGPIAHVHEGARLEQDFPFPDLKIREYGGGETSAGSPGRLTVIPHNHAPHAHLVVVDTPDVDSVEEQNRLLADDLYLLADVVVFVASPEKYADDIPVQVLRRVLGDRKPVYYLLNKARGDLDQKDVLDVLQIREAGLTRNHIWLLPYVAGATSGQLAGEPAVRHFLRTLGTDLAPQKARSLSSAQQKARIQRARDGLLELQGLLEAEDQAGRIWLDRLEQISLETTALILKGEEERFKGHSDQYIRLEIRRLFTRYDPLAKPRRMIQEVLFMPLRLLGVIEARKKGRHQKALARLRRTRDLTPLLTALEQFNRRALEELSPADAESPLGEALRRPELAVGERDIGDRMLKEQEDLLHWIEERFQVLADGLSRKKKWGIYSTSILWGILLLAMETVVGGGFTMVDAVLDSALAPFLTKGAAELFAYKEIQKITRELAAQHQAGLTAIVEEQSLRYRECLLSLLTPPDALKAVETWAREGLNP
jgi:hypothetical protein